MRFEATHRQLDLSFIPSRHGVHKLLKARVRCASMNATKLPEGAKGISTCKFRPRLITRITHSDLQLC